MIHAVYDNIIVMDGNKFRLLRTPASSHNIYSDLVLVLFPVVFLFCKTSTNKDEPRLWDETPISGPKLTIVRGGSVHNSAAFDPRTDASPGYSSPHRQD